MNTQSFSGSDGLNRFYETNINEQNPLIEIKSEGTKIIAKSLPDKADTRSKIELLKREINDLKVAAEFLGRHVLTQRNLPPTLNAKLTHLFRVTTAKLEDIPEEQKIYTETWLAGAFNQHISQDLVPLLSQLEAELEKKQILKEQLPASIGDVGTAVREATAKIIDYLKSNAPEKKNLKDLRKGILEGNASDIKDPALRKLYSRMMADLFLLGDSERKEASTKIADFINELKTTLKREEKKAPQQPSSKPGLSRRVTDRIFSSKAKESVRMHRAYTEPVIAPDAGQPLRPPALSPALGTGIGFAAGASKEDIPPSLKIYKDVNIHILTLTLDPKKASTTPIGDNSLGADLLRIAMSEPSVWKLLDRENHDVMANFNFDRTRLPPNCPVGSGLEKLEIAAQRIEFILRKLMEHAGYHHAEANGVRVMDDRAIAILAAYQDLVALLKERHPSSEQDLAPYLQMLYMTLKLQSRELQDLKQIADRMALAQQVQNASQAKPRDQVLNELEMPLRNQALDGEILLRLQNALQGQDRGFTLCALLNSCANQQLATSLSSAPSRILDRELHIPLDRKPIGIAPLKREITLNEDGGWTLDFTAQNKTAKTADSEPFVIQGHMKATLNPSNLIPDSSQVPNVVIVVKIIGDHKPEVDQKLREFGWL